MNDSWHQCIPLTHIAAQFSRLKWLLSRQEFPLKTEQIEALLSDTVLNLSIMRANTHLTLHYTQNTPLNYYFFFEGLHF